MVGLFILSLKILLNEKIKFISLIIGIAIAVFLMTQTAAICSGVMNRFAANIVNINPPMWVMDASVHVQSDIEIIPIPNNMLEVVRSTPGVEYAVPIFMSFGVVKFPSGQHQIAEVIGLDDESLLGRPPLNEQNIEALRQPNSFIGILNNDYTKLNDLAVGETFELNHQAGRLVGTAKTSVEGLWGTPTLYTTYSSALNAFPSGPDQISYILMKPKTEESIPLIKKSLNALNYLALTQEEFLEKNTDYYLYHTGLGTNIGILEILCFVIGLAITGQTFYMYLLDNLSLFSALKAMGTQQSELIMIILFQSLVAGFIGYGLGLLGSSLFMAFAKTYLPHYTVLVTFENLFISFLMMLAIVAFTSFIGIRKVIYIEPYDIFRG